MAIDVEWQDEDGAVLARYEGPRLDVRLVEHAPAASCCLRFIDPWGATTFNQQQIEVLLDELQRLAEVATVPDVRTAADALAQFISCNRSVDFVEVSMQIVREESPDHLAAQLDARLCAFNESHVGPRRNEKLALAIREGEHLLAGTIRGNLLERAAHRPTVGSGRAPAARLWSLTRTARGGIRARACM